MKDKRFIGSNISIVIGVLLLLAGVSQASSALSAGIYMIMGGLAYKSAKKRKLNIIDSSTKRIIIELVGIVAIFVLLLFTNKVYLIEDPIPHLLIPLWAIIAYIVINLKKEITNKATSTQNASKPN